MEVPEFGGTPEKIDVTTLSDSIKKFVNGVVDMGDLAFKFLYDNSSTTANYRVLRGLQEGGTAAVFKLSYPDGIHAKYNALQLLLIQTFCMNYFLICHGFGKNLQNGKLKMMIAFWMCADQFFHQLVIAMPGVHIAAPAPPQPFLSIRRSNILLTAFQIDDQINRVYLGERSIPLRMFVLIFRFNARFQLYM